jgi:hypothetical protein
LNSTQTTPLGTVLAGPTCQRPLPRCLALSHSIPHPTADNRSPLPPGPTCQLRPHHVARTPPPSLVHETAPPPTPVVWGQLPAAQHCRLLHSPTPLSLLLPPRGRRPPPLFPSLGLRRQANCFQNNVGRHPVPGCCSPHDHAELEPPSFSTAYMSASPVPTTGDPSSSPVPVRAPPPPSLHGETLPSATIVPN